MATFVPFTKRFSPLQNKPNLPTEVLVMTRFKRIEKKRNLNVIDLFSGAGGFGLGATRAGFNLAGAVDIDPRATIVHRKNFPNSPILERDISSISVSQILYELNLTIREIDGIIGGPPCQGFSHMGHGDTTDPRNQLFIHFFQIINDVSPTFLPSRERARNLAP